MAALSFIASLVFMSALTFGVGFCFGAIHEINKRLKNK